MAAHLRTYYFTCIRSCGSTRLCHPQNVSRMEGDPKRACLPPPRSKSLSRDSDRHEKPSDTHMDYIRLPGEEARCNTQHAHQNPKAMTAILPGPQRHLMGVGQTKTIDETHRTMPRRDWSSALERLRRTGPSQNLSNITLLWESKNSFYRLAGARDAR
jgi:hypothetical protein